MKLTVAVIIIILALLALFALRPRDTAFHRNVRPFVTRILIVITLLILVAAALYFAMTVKNEGVGNLIANRGNTETVGTAESEGKVLEIKISTDYIRIGRHKYTDPSETIEVLKEAAKEGKRFVLTDDYASASLYIEVKDILFKLGVSSEDIEEYREP